MTVRDDDFKEVITKSYCKHTYTDYWHISVAVWCDTIAGRNVYED
ncbi:MAG: hypothetical protein U0M19_03360 [Caecibacter sp.]|nr:hypothetical protein [Caecibacter sp.]